ncbi:hypothetical protein FGSG_13226 [Fusarium graminearum PH-1]|uniref:Chromosome 4, complete genome n=1 Tax=Gibberella zeae (strain ATCC MYA-4620 / CBS 123657 / FGSC 9075 / NRRL 31084 / PH-1) TaxID=229533 RepID=I1S8P8_GIBZE|nr:hypothetical protein FGSG_13226 [Fusarium graminearum PH-1]ESU14123.1 hypothetical protein FGSG_13226 [Fusarium graminearum PH-1]EYB22348.1 hypothetical protein FG05_13226 [Fusarium graminearum]CEF84059.1 unnamed protein product [Fusarium graminearum]|eukprot:XP_011327630.1 hypothetical protein FGSG_13226 [Fusarium graminearum PH-1]
MLLSLGVASSDANCELSSGANNNSSQSMAFRPLSILKHCTNVDAVFLLFVSRTRRLSSSMTGNDDPWGRYMPFSELTTTPFQQGTIAIIFIMTALSILVWAVRIYSRLSKKQVGLNDWLVTVVTIWKPLS